VVTDWSETHSARSRYAEWASRGSDATAPCAAAAEPSVSGFLVGGEERECEGLGVGQ
jgi:hypothetical protein